MNAPRMIDTVRRVAPDALLWALLLSGLLGAAKVSLANATGSPCPHLLVLPVCYVVLLAYAAMALSMMIRHVDRRHHLFRIGWGVAFVIALLGSLAEVLAGGGVCPSAGVASVPLCFVSLAMLVIILLLFLRGPYRRVIARSPERG